MKTIKRTYECKTKIHNGFCFCLTLVIHFDEKTKIKEVESELKRYAAKEFTKGSFSFAPEDIRLKRIA